jgi:hypothetical protein
MDEGIPTGALYRTVEEHPSSRGLSQTFFVKSRMGTFRIVGVRSDVAALDIRVAPTGGASGSFQIDAGLRPAALVPGALDGTITIETDDPEFRTLTVRVHGKVVE